MKTAVYGAFAALALSLGGCATGPDMTGWTPEQIQAYNAEMYRMMALTNQSLQQSNAMTQQVIQNGRTQMGTMSAPQIDNPSQPQGAWVYCNKTSSYTMNCRE